jgi:hypothetical protein
MSITELIEKLEKIKADHGNLTVYYKDLADKEGSELVNSVTPEWPYKVEGGLVQFGCNDYTQAPYGVEIG